MHKSVSSVALAVTVLLGSLGVLATPRAAAAGPILYGTSFDGQFLFTYDTNQNVTFTNIRNTTTPANNHPDSLLFDTAGRLIYGDFTNGTVRRFDMVANTDTVIATGILGPADMVLQPGGGSMLIGGIGGGKIYRLDLTTLALTVFLDTAAAGFGNDPEGLAYIGGRLFANLGNRSSAGDKTLAEITVGAGGLTGTVSANRTPWSGAIINSHDGTPWLDGLTYDPVSNRLWASLFASDLICSYDPNALTDNSKRQCFTGIPGPDGLTSDFAGNIWIASKTGNRIYQFAVGTNTLTARNPLINGIDDLAPAAGPGSNNPVPEPATLVLVGLGLCGVVVRRLRTRA